jgi:polyisoprenoid-binding protein YceI
MTWTIDKSRTKLEFAVRHMMIHTVRGNFRDYEVDLDIDADDLTKSSVKAHIETKSVSTKDSLRDDYLVSKNFFNPSEFPHIVFESTSARLSGKKLSVSGRLKIRDKEHQLILTGSVKGPKSGFGGGARRLTFDLTGEVAREPYNLVFNGAVETVSIVVGKKVNLLLSIDLVES